MDSARLLARFFRLAFGLVFLLFAFVELGLSQNPARGLQNRSYVRAREQWFYRGRIAPPGHTSAEMRLRAHQQKMRLRKLRAQAAAQSATTLAVSGWQPLGPAPLASDATGVGMQDYGPVSGRVTAVVVDPADTTGNTVYIGGAYGGLWRSQNAAAGSYGNPSAVTWAPLTDAQPTLATGAIAVQPANVTNNLSNVILVGTGEANTFRDSYYGLGFLRSTNQGASWTLITSADGGAHPFKGLAISKIVFSTQPNTTVVAGVGFSTPGQIEGGDDLNTTPHGIYYALDAGATWHLATVQDSGTTITPDSARGIVYNPATNKFYAAIRRHGFYSSADGVTWSRLANQPGGAVLAAANCPTTGSPTCPIVRGELAVVPGRNEMYAWFSDFDPAADPPDVDQGIWQTIDGGAHWNRISTSGIDSCGDIVGGCGAEQGEYNMALAAVPNGSATDLYAGAVNLFKCSLNVNNPDCSSNPFLNLTHVYGCPPNFGSIAHVHPNQHAVGSMLVNNGTRSIMYFGNDGGVYRALDGYTGLTTGSCSGTNQFDSLNGTLGSLTQFIAISQDPNDANVLLGGTQDNGSPATTTATSSTTWGNVNNGDGGFNVIDPASPSSWFTSHPDVGGGQLAIEHCTLGINCHAQDFAAEIVVSSYDLQGDDGAFYFPYLLDPQASGEMLVGTCRVWQGPALGGSFTALSDNFETGTNTTCLGSEVNTVTAIAAGGPKTSSGFSKVVYATTSGFGPLTTLLGVPAGGRVFVTTDSSTTPMSEVTGSINPIYYPISSVAIDNSDPGGQTAYVTIMGFGTPHVFKTTNAGTNWTDFTGTGLPDAPVNAVLVDELAGMVYLGTDVGVFGSATAAALWTEVGPASGAGAFPNTTVFDLKLFRAGGQTYLRAATHGRGVWQIAVTPGFQIAISNSPRTIYPTQQAKFNGTLTALGGYNSSVALSCTPATTAPPATCTPSPSNVTPTPSGAAFQVTATDAVGDYIFNIHGEGSDSNHITQDQSVTLHVVDFSLSSPNPPSVTANRPNNSNPTTFQVTAYGSFNQTVQLTCTGLPSGGSCNFSSNPVAPTAGNPVTVTLIIGTGANTPAGNYSVTIKGSTTGPAMTKTQTLGLTVTALPDFVLSISDSPQSAWAGQTAIFHGKLTAANGYASAVNLSCAAGTTSPPPTCTPNPASITPTSSGASFTLSTGSSIGQSYAFSLVATGTDANHISHTVPVAFNSVDYSVASTPNARTIKPGQTASFVLHVVPVGGNFLANVALSCSDLPALATCAFNPNSIVAGSGATDVTLTITTRGPNLSGVEAHAHWNPGVLFLSLPLIAITLGVASSPRRRRSQGAIALLAVVSIAELTLLQACGGGASTGGSPPPPGQVSVTVLPESANLMIGEIQQFQARVVGTTDTRVTWQVNTTPGGDSVLGIIDGNGRYTAPAFVPKPNVVSVVAVSVADTTKSDSAGVNVTSSTSLAISPTTVSVPLGGTQQFTATVTGVANTRVAWSMNGRTGGDTTFGAIDANGLYTAPVSVPNPSTVTITATSQADWRKQASATVTLASVSISISPPAASVYTNGHQQFTATVTGTTNTQVSWNVNGTSGGNTTVGTIDGAGLYTAPNSVPNPATVTVGAVSQADPNKSASAAVTILPSTPLGSYAVKITAAAGPLTRNTTVTLNVVP